MPLISVIVPVYNASRYLRQCLDSIVNQTLKDIEIICVDDESTDDSMCILQEYAKNDSRIRIKQQVHRGAGVARNTGMDGATGKYLLFLDSDDFFDLRLCEKLYNKAIDENSDIVVCNIAYFDTVCKKILEEHVLAVPSIDRDCVAYSDVSHMDDGFSIYFLTVWNKLYRSEFVFETGVKFQDILHYNDQFFMILTLLQAHTISVINDDLVYYRVNGNRNLQSLLHQNPYDFSDAVFAVRNALNMLNLLSKYKRNFLEYALHTCVYQERKLRNFECHNEICSYILNQYSRSTEICNHTIFHYKNKQEYWDYLKILYLSPEELDTGKRIYDIKILIQHPFQFLVVLAYLIHKICTANITINLRVWIKEKIGKFLNPIRL